MMFLWVEPVRCFVVFCSLAVEDNNGYRSNVYEYNFTHILDNYYTGRWEMAEHDHRNILRDIFSGLK